MVTNAEVDILAPDMFGLTAWHKLASWGNCELLSLLAPLMSQEERNRLSASEGYSALHWCVEMECLDSFLLLLQNRWVDTELRDKKGRSVKEFARAMGLNEFEAALENHGS
jgi:ankyrin repeat protein